MGNTLAPSGPARPFDVVLSNFEASPESLSPGQRAELQALLKEKDPELLYEGLSSLGSRLERAGKAESAAYLYTAILESLPEGADSDLSRKVRGRLDGIQGQGAFGGRAEFLLSRFAKDAFDPKTIAPMMLGTSVFSLTRTWALGRFGTSALFRTVGPRLAASSLGFAAEVPAFALGSRALRPDSSQEPSIGHELAGAAITLGFLKSFGHAGQALGALSAFRNSSQFSHQLLSQTAMFGGLMTAHKLEERLGLRLHVDGATTITDTLASMLSLGIGASLAHRALGLRYAAMQGELNGRFRTYSNAVKLEAKSPFILEPMMMAAGVGRPGEPAGDGKNTEHVSISRETSRNSKSPKLGRQVLIDRIQRISGGKVDRQEAASLLDVAADRWTKTLGPWGKLVFQERILAENPAPRRAFQASMGWESWPRHVHENRILKKFTDQALKPAVAEFLNQRNSEVPKDPEISEFDLAELLRIPQLENNRVHDLQARQGERGLQFLSASKGLDIPLGKLNLSGEVESALLQGGMATVGMLMSATSHELLQGTTLSWMEIRYLENRLKVLGLGFKDSLDRHQRVLPDASLARFPFSVETLNLFQKMNIRSLHQLEGASPGYALINAYKFLTNDGVTLPDIWRAQDEIAGLGFSCFVTFPDSEEVHRLPAMKLVRPAAQKKLTRDGIQTLGDLLKLPKVQIVRKKYFAPADLKRLFQAVDKLGD